MNDLAALEFVDPTVVDSRYRVLLYGQAGAGKSCGAASAPGPVLVLSADRPGAYRFARTLHPPGHIQEVRVTGADVLRLAYDHVRRHPRDQQTVVVDPVGGVYDILLRELGGAKPQIQHHGQVQQRIVEMIIAFRDLPVHLVLVAHEELEESEEAGSIRRPLVGGQKLGPKIEKEVDIIARCGREIHPETQDRYMAAFVSTRSAVGKDSTGALGRVRELDLAEWFATATAALHPHADDSDLPFALNEKAAT